MITKKNNGFTLIELLIVVAIVAILSAVVLIAVNPTRQMAQARNAERSAEINAILSAISQFYIDSQALPACIPSVTPLCIGTDATCCDLSGDLAPDYIAEIPIGPGAACDALNTCYTVIKTASDRITVAASDSELGLTISVTR